MAYATVEDLEIRWGKTLTESEAERAEVRLDDASLYLDVIIEEYGIDAIAKADALKVVCCDMVQRKLEAASASPISSVTQQAGAFSETMSYARPYKKSWELYPEDMLLLGINAGQKRARCIQVEIRD